MYGNGLVSTSLDGWRIGELGNKANIGVFLRSSAMSPPNFALYRERRFYCEISVKKCVFSVLPVSRRDRAEL